MKSVLRYARGCAWAALFGLLLPGPAAAAPQPVRDYKTGLAAAEAGDWAQVDKMMRRAIAGRPEEKKRRRLLLGGYFPHYYRGLARYHLGDCPGALASWAESEGQGAIVGRDEYAELLRRKADCRKNSAPSLGSRSSTPTSSSAKSGKTGKETARTGQRMLERGAGSTQKGLSSLERVAPTGSGLDQVAREGRELVGVAEAASNLVDLVLPPKQKLETAVDAYFSGDPERTLEILEAIDMSDPRARAQVYLFRAAASFRLHLLAGRDETHLATARENADLFRQEQWSDDFPAEFFDPRFVRFMGGG